MAAKALFAASIIFMSIVGVLLSFSLPVEDPAPVGGTGLLSVEKGLLIVSSVELYDGDAAASAYFDRVWATMYVQDASLAGTYEVQIKIYNDGALYAATSIVFISTSPSRFLFLLPEKIQQGLEVRVNVAARRLS